MIKLIFISINTLTNQPTKSVEFSGYFLHVPLSKSSLLNLLHFSSYCSPLSPLSLSLSPHCLLQWSFLLLTCLNVVVHLYLLNFNQKDFILSSFTSLSCSLLSLLLQRLSFFSGLPWFFLSTSFFNVCLSVYLVISFLYFLTYPLKHIDYSLLQGFNIFAIVFQLNIIYFLLGGFSTLCYSNIVLLMTPLLLFFIIYLYIFCPLFAP